MNIPSLCKAYRQGLDEEAQPNPALLLLCFFVGVALLATFPLSQIKSPHIRFLSEKSDFILNLKRTTRILMTKDRPADTVIDARIPLPII
jgi:hypothetical protein